MYWVKGNVIIEIQVVIIIHLILDVKQKKRRSPFYYKSKAKRRLLKMKKARPGANIQSLPRWINISPTPRRLRLHLQRRRFLVQKSPRNPLRGARSKSFFAFAFFFFLLHSILMLSWQTIALDSKSQFSHSTLT